MALIKEERFSSTRPNTIGFQLAIRHTVNKFELPTEAKLLHLKDVFKTDLNIWDESPGLPWKELGYKTKGDIKKDPEAIRRVRKFWHFVKDNDGDISFPACCAYARKKEKGEFKVKTVPATITFGEAVFAVPLIQAYQNETSPIAYEFEAANGGKRKLMKRISRRANYAVIEFKNFASSIPKLLIDIAFEILSLNIDFNEYRYYGAADSGRMHRMYLELTNYLLNTKIRLPSGRRIVKHVGLTSGSFFRKLVHSVVNHILLSWYSFEMFGRAPDDILVMGANALVASETAWNLEDFNKLMSTIGFTVNKNKSQISKKLHKLIFHRCKNNTGFAGKRSTTISMPVSGPKNNKIKTSSSSALVQTEPKFTDNCDNNKHKRKRRRNSNKT